MQPASSNVSVVISLHGELDLLTAPAVSEELLAIAKVAQASEIVVDLSDVTFMDSAGLKPITEAVTLLRQRDKTLRLCGVTRSSAHLIRAAGLARSLNIHDITDSDLAPAPVAAPVLPIQRVHSQSDRPSED